MKFQIKHLFILVGLVSILLGTLGYGGVAVGDGSYDLTILLDSASAAEVKSISYFVASSEEIADAVLADLDHCESELLHQDSADPLVIQCFYSFRVWGFGQVTKGSQSCSHVVLCLHYTDGDTAIYKVEAPHRRDSQNVIVSPKSLVRRIEATNDQR